MTPEELNQLKQRHKIFDVANRLGLTKHRLDLSSQSAYNVSCPNTFAHKNGDKNPSLALLPNTNRFYCYGCGNKGDVINLVQQSLNIGFQEAVLWLEPGIDLYPTNNKEAKEYLKKKGLSHETLTKFKVYVGDGWHEDVKYPAVYFPVPGGLKYRLLGCDTCKYKHAKGTSISLFKTDEGKKSDTVVLCEGELDAMAGWQNTSYPFWTSTGGAATFYKSWVSDFSKHDRVIIGFDNDEAGRTGAIKVIQTLIDGGVERSKIIQIEVPIPELLGKDWCDYFSAGMKKEDFDELIVNASKKVTAL